MRPSHVCEALHHLVRIRQPVFLWGPPGVGKSRLVADVARRQGRKLYDLRAVLLDPVDLRGLPRISDEGITSWCVPEFLPHPQDTEEGILFLDELNAAPPLVQAACYQLILDRRVGQYRLPDGWAVVAAGNRESDRAVTYRMPSALANRMVHLDVECHIDDWLDWARANGIREEIQAFLRFRPRLLHDFDPRSSDRAFASPRSWEFASRILDAAPDGPLEEELLAGTIGQAAAAELSGFLREWRHLPSVESVLSDPEEAPVPADPASLYALCEALALRTAPATMEALAAYAGRLPAEFGVLLMRDAVRQDPRPERPSASQGMRHSPAADVPAPPLEQRALTAMIRARADLVLRQPFFGSLALHLALKPDSTCRHLWTDGHTLGFNPVWAATLPHERLVGAQAHEVMHLACAHHVRRNGRDARIWNEACDVVVDALLLGAGFRLPQGHLEHPEYAGLSVDEVYSRLASLQDTPLHGGAQQQAAGRSPREKGSDQQRHDGRERQDAPAAAPSRAGETDEAAAPEAAGTARPAGDKPEREQPVPYFSGEVRDHPLLEDGQGDARRKAEQEAELRLEQALQRARHMGREPAGFSRLLRGGRHDGGTDWRGLLRRFLENCALNDYTWSAPNRRYLHHGIYLPGRQEQRIPQLAVAVDCSGSVDDATLSLFCEELSSILAAYETELVVIFHDSRVQAVQTFRRQDLPLHLAPVGGGGTDFRPVGRWLDDNGLRPACLLWFTDLECSSFPDEPACPLLWAVWGQGGEQPPFGELLRLPAGA